MCKIYYSGFWCSLRSLFVEKQPADPADSRRFFTHSLTHYPRNFHHRLRRLTQSVSPIFQLNADLRTLNTELQSPRDNYMYFCTMIPKDSIRKIIHIDMDAFYASVEQLDNPELKGKAMVVGSSSSRGVVAAASYEARKYGVYSAMSSTKAKQLCPHLIFVDGRMERYAEVSKQIRKIFYTYTDLVEPLSLDEAYLDVTVNKKEDPSASRIARKIRKEIYETTGLTASAGISTNKFLAKVASDINKPNGQKTIPPEEAISFLEGLEIKQFYGVGKVTLKKMYDLGIFTGADLKIKTEAFLEEHFGKSGSHFYHIVRGVHPSPVSPSRTRKSLAVERTFSENLSSELFMMDRLKEIAEKVAYRLEQNKLKGRTLTLKIRYSDFQIQTRSITLDYPLSNAIGILSVAKGLLYQEKLDNSVRLLGLSVSNFNLDEVNSKGQTPIAVQLRFDF